MSSATWERNGGVALAILLVALGGLSFHRAVREKFDFHHFYLDARYVWEHGELNPNVVRPPKIDDHRQLPFYLPVVPLVIAPMAAFGPVWGALVWAAAQLVCLGYTLRVLRKWLPEGAAGHWLLLAALLAAPAFVEASRFNQVSYFVLALLVGGVDAAVRGRPLRGGALLAGAAVLKLLPGLLLVWLVVKRQWVAVVAFCVAGVMLTAVPPLLAFGPAQAWNYHLEWWEYNVRGGSGDLLDPNLDAHFIDHRNQSIKQTLARWTWAEHPFPAPWRPVLLEREQIVQIGRAVAVVLLGGLLWLTRRPGKNLDNDRQRAEAAVYMLGLLVFSPLMRQYYLVWALPTVVLLVGAAFAHHGITNAVGRPWPARVGLVVWVAGLLAWVWETPRDMGAHLVMLITLGGLLLAAYPVQRGKPGLMRN